MSIHVRTWLPAVLVAVASSAACDSSVKEIRLENRADVAVAVAVGDADFGVVPAGAVLEPREVDDGALTLRLDGVAVDTIELGSDNVSGLWGLIVDRYEPQPGVFQWTWGYGLESDGR